MNNIKKTITGTLIGAMAFGISAFTAAKNKTVIRYYKTDTTTAANDARGYKYYSDDRCEAVGNLCSAQWDIGTNPQPTTDGDALPLTGVTFQTGTIITGHFE